MEERIARVEGISEQIRDRLNGIEHTVDTRFAQVESRFVQIESRFAQIDARFGQIDARFGQLDTRFGTFEARFSQMDARFMWLTGIVIGTWITTILTILFRH
ncbi:MAG: hypothetical protein WBW76_06895 [Candidatus Cybelea sp.]